MRFDRMIQLECDDAVISEAFKIAVGDIVGNIHPFKDGLLEAPSPVLMAGLDYGTPWTRDAAINSWNAASLMFPEVAGATLLSVLERGDDGLPRIGGEYWDSIIWACGAWNHYLCVGGKDFLRTAFDATRGSLGHLERTEFDSERGLFRGPACCQDGVAAYPDGYAETGGSPGIVDWARVNPGRRAAAGVGLPMFALSTNCLYFAAYGRLESMALELGIAPDPEWHAKAKRLHAAVNREFWSDSLGNYRYLVGPFGECDHQEALGTAFAVLFGVASRARAESVFKTQRRSAAGTPCVWPSFERYSRLGAGVYGRHSGVVWPQAQGFFAEAAAENGRMDIFESELRSLASHAGRDGHFNEIFHPETGLPYGGMQEFHERGVVEWKSCRRQSWSATAFIRMVLNGMIGLELTRTGPAFAPRLPDAVGRLSISGLELRGEPFDIEVHRTGSRTDVKVNGHAAARIED